MEKSLWAAGSRVLIAAGTVKPNVGRHFQRFFDGPIQDRGSFISYAMPSLFRAWLALGSPLWGMATPLFFD
jgi:hypothetical protein